MWQRWNQSSHIFEKSIDNGATWTPLGLNASIITEGTLSNARLSSNVALKDIDNNFSVGQSFFQKIILKDGANPAFTIENSGGYLRFINPSYGQVAYMDMVGTLSLPGSGGSGGALSASSFIRGAYFYEFGRSIIAGQRQGWNPTIVTDAGSGISGSIACSYSVQGAKVSFELYIANFSIPAATSYIAVSGPPGFLPGLPAWEFMLTRIYVGGVGPDLGYIDVVAGYGLRVWRNSGAAWPAGGTMYILGQGFYYLS